MTFSTILSSLPVVSLQVTSGASSASHQHPNIGILDFHRLEEGLFCLGQKDLGKEFLILVSRVVCVSYSGACCSKQGILYVNSNGAGLNPVPLIWILCKKRGLKLPLDVGSVLHHGC